MTHDGMDVHLIKRQIHQQALGLGFSFMGVARAEYMDEEARRLEA